MAFGRNGRLVWGLVIIGIDTTKATCDDGEWCGRMLN